MFTSVDKCTNTDIKTRHIQQTVSILGNVIFTDRVRSTMGRLCFDSCLSFCLSTPQPGPAGGYPDGGVPHLGYPPPIRPGGGEGWGTDGGYPTSGTPPSDLARGGAPMDGTPPQVSPSRPGRGVPNGGYPTSGTPPHRTWLGGTSTGGGGYPTSVVLDTPRSVCLLRSRRRTFLLPTYRQYWC